KPVQGTTYIIVLQYDWFTDVTHSYLVAVHGVRKYIEGRASLSESISSLFWFPFSLSLSAIPGTEKNGRSYPNLPESGIKKIAVEIYF
ncbi:hypothetical protein GGP41_005482, partial [Bipolaris sorokiniana]